MASLAARHRFDPVSFVLGVMAVTAGLIVLGGGSLLDDATVLFPAGLIALGVAILLQVGARREEPPGPVTVPSPPTGVAGQTLSGADLYDLLVPDPTEEFLAELAEREHSARPPGGEHPAVETDPGPGPAPAADPTEPAGAATEPAADPTEPAAAEPEPAADPTEPDRRPGRALRPNRARRRPGRPCRRPGRALRRDRARRRTGRSERAPTGPRPRHRVVALSGPTWIAIGRPGRSRRVGPSDHAPSGRTSLAVNGQRRPIATWRMIASPRALRAACADPLVRGGAPRAVGEQRSHRGGSRAERSPPAPRAARRRGRHPRHAGGRATRRTACPTPVLRR